MIEKLPNLLSKNHDNEEYIKQTKNSTDKIRNELLNSSKKTALTKTKLQIYFVPQRAKWKSRV